ncbi:MAG: AMP-binding protein [Rhizobiales bacterium]|nr:AMP-binding protein [Hyphomicrobiales bacterium]
MANSAEKLSSPPAIRDVNACRGLDLSYEDIRRRYVVETPREYNLATDTVTRRAKGRDGGQIALVVDRPDRASARYTFAELDLLSDRFAQFLSLRGVRRGDVVIVYAGQGLAAAVAPLAIYKLGAISAPLSLLYGPRTIEHVIGDSGAKVMVSEADALEGLEAGGVGLQQISTLVVDGQSGRATHRFEETIADGIERRAPETTRAEDPALLLYTSGSTGLPKGILHAHRFLTGYFSSVSLFYELDMASPGMRLWTPSDWSWIAGIVNVMLTGWHFGHTVVAGQGRFTPEWAFDFLERNRVTHCFLTPTALKRMAQMDEPRRRWPELALRAIGTGGEPLPSAVLDWFARELDLPVNEFYGLTEVNHLVGNSSGLFPVRPGSMGKAYPGHRIEMLDEAGRPVADGTLGEIAAHESDPTLFLGYWGQPERTAAMRTGEWVRTGDFGVRDEDGYFWYHGRNDDLIKSAGYRIGPAEVEDCLVRHPDVAEAAVIGRADSERGQVVVAYVRCREGIVGDARLREALQRHVKTELAVYKYPRDIVFVDGFPTTSTGKISRKELRLLEESKPAAGG